MPPHPAPHLSTPRRGQWPLLQSGGTRPLSQARPAGWLPRSPAWPPGFVGTVWQEQVVPAVLSFLVWSRKWPPAQGPFCVAERGSWEAGSARPAPLCSLAILTHITCFKQLSLARCKTAELRPRL